MKNFRKQNALLLTIALIFNMFVLIQPVLAQDENICYYVSAKGADSNEGTIEKPFASLEKARDTIRELKSKGLYPKSGVVVYIRGGLYNRSTPFELNEQDSGAENAPVVYRAYADENVEIVGGASLTMPDFKKIVDEEIIKRLPQGMATKVLQTDLKTKGITDYGTMPLFGHSMFFLDAVTQYKTGSPSPELFFNGKVMTLSRWPNNEYTKISEIIDGGSQPRYWMDDMKTNADYIAPEKRDNPPKGFKFKAELADKARLTRWAKADDIWMYGYWFWDWSDQSVKVASIDLASSVISSVQPSGYGLKTNQKMYFYNLFEEIDQPGEWYLDRSSGILYFYPPANDSKAKIQLSLTTNPFIIMNNASNIQIKNLSLQLARENAIVIKGGENNTIVNCSISKLGANAINISGGKNNGVKGCHIFDTGSGGVNLSGGDRVTLTPAGNYVENCEINNFSRIVKTYSGAISMSGVGNRISNNKIYDGAHLAIKWAGNDHIINNNEIFEVCKEADDMGAIYSGRNTTMRGNVIKNNYIHDIQSESENSVGVHAMYFDDCFSSAEISNNLIVNVKGSGVLINSGRDFKVENNVFANMKYAVAISDVGLYDKLVKSSWDAHGFGTKKDPYGEAMVPYKKEPYTKYPHLANILEDEPGYPKYNIVTKNVYYNLSDQTDGFYFWHFTTPATLDDITKRNTIKDNLIEKNSDIFVDAKNNDYRLRDDSEAYTKLQGLEKIDYERMGLYSIKIKEKMSNAVALLIGSPYSYVNNTNKQVDDKNIEVMPMVNNGRTLVPVRFISESFGATVSWDANTSKVTVTKDNNSIELVLGSKEMSINGKIQQLDVPAQSVAGRTLIPLRALVEALGKKVFWDAKGLIVISDIDKIFDSKVDNGIIDNLISKISLR